MPGAAAARVVLQIGASFRLAGDSVDCRASLSRSESLRFARLTPSCCGSCPGRIRYRSRERQFQDVHTMFSMFSEAPARYRAKVTALRLHHAATSSYAVSCRADSRLARHFVSLGESVTFAYTWGMNAGNSLDDSVDRAPAMEGGGASRGPVFDASSAPFLTADLPGIGGIIRQSPLDFEVEEISAYEPCGEGEHLFLWIEKRETSAEFLVSHLSRVLAIPKTEIGVAGLKDRHALTRQYVSVPARSSEKIAEVTTDTIRVLRCAMHRNKLRTGHLRGNRFSILVREVCQDAGSKAEAVQEKLAAHGFPNYFGSQRFGIDRQTEIMGFALLRGESKPRAIPYSRRKFLLRFALSAAQSALFNLALGERIADGRLMQVLPGDVMQVIGSGGLFVVSDVATEQHRFETGETVMTGPMFGPKMIQPEGEPQASEACLLERHGLDPRDFTRFHKFTAGTRRPLLVQPEELSIETVSEGLRFRFALPPGAYATMLLREFLKQPDLL